MTDAKTSHPAAPPADRTGVWANQDFVRLWAGQTVSQLGSMVTWVALPLVAVVFLHASTAQMGLLSAVGRVPYMFYLVAGVTADRVRRRPLLMATDLGRGLLLLAIPLAATAHVLTLTWLMAILFAEMTLSVWFDISYLSYIPSLVERPQLMAANTVMETSNSTARFAGPGLGGILVQLFTAPFAILADSASYFLSAFAVWRIRRPEPPPSIERGGGLREIASSVATGLRFVRRSKVLGPLALAVGVNNIFWAAELALYVFFLARGLHLGAAVIGLTLAAQGPGAIAGSALAGHVQRLAGVSGAIIGGLALFAFSALLIPASPRQGIVAVPMLVLAGFLMAGGGQVCSINIITTRQTISPPELLGRVNASFRFMAFGTSPLGSLLGGLLGTLLGARGGLFVAVAGMFLAPLILCLSPVRTVRLMTDGVAGPDQSSGGDT